MKTRVVLVEPAVEANIGAVARAMMNMSVTDLVLVNPECNHLNGNAVKVAVHAAEILDNATVVPTLAEAIAGSTLSVAITRRTGHYRQRDFDPRSLARHAVETGTENLTLVFGREASGLTDAEIKACDLVCFIPSDREFPSLNLSHAVMVVLYELFYLQNTEPVNKVSSPASRQDFDKMLSMLLSALDEMDFFKKVPQIRLESYIRKILLKSGLDRYGTLVVHNLFSRLKGKVKQYKKDKEELSKLLTEKKK